MSGREFSSSSFSAELSNSFSFEIFAFSLISWNELSAIFAKIFACHSIFLERTA